MPTLVLSDRSIWHVSSKAELNTFCEEHGVGWKLEGNLAQLLRLAPVGRGSTSGRQRGGYFLLDSGSWLRHPSLSYHVPVFGSAPEKYA